MIDIRLPIGGLFSILGLMLVGYGIHTFGNTEMYAKSLNININIWWGLVMLVFGALMLYFGLRAGSRKAKAQEAQTQPQEKGGMGH